ncbi:hypothetical protein TSHO111613_16945 [Tsukamurella hominis]
MHTEYRYKAVGVWLSSADTPTRRSESRIVPLETVLEAHDELRAAFVAMNECDRGAVPARAALTVLRRLVDADTAVARAAAAYAAEPAPDPATTPGGAFALALHAISTRAVAEGLVDDMERYADATLNRPGTPHPQPRRPELQAEIVLATMDLIEHLREHSIDQWRQDLIDHIERLGGTASSSIKVHPAESADHHETAMDDDTVDIEDILTGGLAAIERAGGPADAIRIGEIRHAVEPMAQHLRRPAWRAAIRVVGRGSCDSDIAEGARLPQVLAAALPARQGLPAGCTIDLYRRTLVGWKLHDTLPATSREKCPLGGEFSGGEYIRAGDHVIGVLVHDAGRWRYGYAADEPGADRVQRLTESTRAAAVARLRDHHCGQ